MEDSRQCALFSLLQKAQVATKCAALSPTPVQEMRPMPWKSEKKRVIFEKNRFISSFHVAKCTFRVREMYIPKREMYVSRREIKNWNGSFSFFKQIFNNL